MVTIQVWVYAWEFTGFAVWNYVQIRIYLSIYLYLYIKLDMRWVKPTTMAKISIPFEIVKSCSTLTHTPTLQVQNISSFRNLFFIITRNEKWFPVRDKLHLITIHSYINRERELKRRITTTTSSNFSNKHMRSLLLI